MGFHASQGDFPGPLALLTKSLTAQKRKPDPEESGFLF
jgi:hypothetical protein